MRQTNPPSNPELLDALAQHFIASGFDLKDLVRTICTSSTYQLSSLPNDHNLKDRQNFSRYYPKRLSAEVLYDAFHRVTATSQSYRGSAGRHAGHAASRPERGDVFPQGLRTAAGGHGVRVRAISGSQSGPEPAFA